MYFKSRLSQSLGLSCILSTCPYKQKKSSVVLVHCFKISVRALHIGVTNCPDFIWVSNNFLIIWYSAVVLIQYEVITHWCFGCCKVVLTPNPALSSFLCFTREQVHEKSGGRTARTADPNGQRDIPYRRMSCPGHKLEAVRCDRVSTGWTAVLCITCFSWILFLSLFCITIFLLLLSLQYVLQYIINSIPTEIRTLTKL